MSKFSRIKTNLVERISYQQVICTTVLLPAHHHEKAAPTFSQIQSDAWPFLMQTSSLDYLLPCRCGTVLGNCLNASVALLWSTCWVEAEGNMLAQHSSIITVFQSHFRGPVLTYTVVETKGFQTLNTGFPFSPCCIPHDPPRGNYSVPSSLCNDVGNAWRHSGIFEALCQKHF